MGKKPMTRGTELKNQAVRVPLVIKLIGITSCIVGLSMGLVSLLSWLLYSSDAQVRAEDNNFELSEVLSAQVQSEIDRVHDGILTQFDTIRTAHGSSGQAAETALAFFNRNASIIYASVPGEYDLTNTKFFLANELNQDLIAGYLKDHLDLLARAKAGETLVVNTTPTFGLPSVALLFPYGDFGTPNCIVVIFSTETLQTMVSTKSTSISYVVDYAGKIIAHPDPNLVKVAASFADQPLVAALLKASTDNAQTRFRAVEPTTGKTIEYLGAFRKLRLGQLGVASVIPADTVYAAALRITQQNIELTGVVLLLSILGVWFFARSVSWPVLQLVKASRQIEEGQFELEIKPSSRDELGLLTASFVEMGRGLAERERVKETFGKFVNKEIAELALKGNLELGGARRQATIFFSDIRSFTAISEAMEPEDVVEFLNAYMTRMVACIEQTGGVVDKFIGDAIMGVWGAPLSKGSPEADAKAAVDAMLLMRSSLIEFNSDRGIPGKPIIRIGCGLNTGPCLAGQIGSQQRMEYTVIGDAVNLASRLEALNKPFGTDILISENTWNLVGPDYLTELMPAIKVKGKNDPLKIFAVVNHRSVEGPQTLVEVRKLLGITAPQGPVDTEQEEIKYEILPH